MSGNKLGRLGNRADREPVVAGVLITQLDELEPSEPVLVVDDDSGLAVAYLRERGALVVPWWRRALDGRAAQPWPESTAVGSAILRIPRDWPSFEMQCHAIASCLPTGGQLLLYGANDEGIKTAQKRVTDHFFEEPETLHIKRRCRVVACSREAEPGAIKANLDDWRTKVQVALPFGSTQRQFELASYPGVFSRGRLDPGTEILLGALPQLKPRTRVLDFGCGIGLIALWATQQWPGCQTTVLDVDSVSLAAAELNVPGATPVLSDGWRALSVGTRYDAIISNPPIHRGREEDLSTAIELVQRAKQFLTPAGVLVVVAQRTVGLGRVFNESFAKPRLLAESTSFQVWCGSRK